tara:strand:- start:497 stop:715 length:219 start_codon:yes stop_codon:yes gene_type:complete
MVVSERALHDARFPIIPISGHECVFECSGNANGFTFVDVSLNLFHVSNKQNRDEIMWHRDAFIPEVVKIVRI